MSSTDNCIVCKEKVRPRQESLQCDGCNLWNHRTCNTGVSRQDYCSSLSWPKTGTLMAHLNSVVSPSPNCLPSTPLWGVASKPNRFLCCLSSCLVRESGTTVQCCKKCWEYFLHLQQSEASLWTLNKLSGRSLESCFPTCHCRDVCFTGRKRCGER